MKISQSKARGLATRPWSGVLLLAVLYLASALLSAQLTIGPQILASIWIPAGVWLAGLLLLPWWAMGPAFVAVFVASVAANLIMGAPLAPSVGFSIANCVGEFVGALALKRALGKKDLGDLKWLVYLIVFGAGLASSVGATVGAAVASHFGYSHFGNAWIAWFLANAWGILIVVPLVLTYGQIRRFFADAVPQAWIELLVMSVLLPALATAVWTRHGAATTYGFVAPYLIFPLLVWVALRFGMAGATLGSFILSSLVLFTTAHGLGRFALAYETMPTRAVELQVFMMMATICSLVAAAIISDQRRIGASLRYVSSIVESSDAAIIGKSLDGTITSWNQAAELLYGYKAQEIIGRPVSVLAPDDHRDEVSMIHTIDGHVADSESVGQRKDGSRIDVWVKVSPIRNGSGEVVGTSSIVRDITEQKRTQQALRESEERFRTIFENAAVGMAQVGLDGRWLRVNDRLCQIVGYTRQELEYQKFKDITHPEDVSANLIAGERLSRGDANSYSIEKRYIHKDGHTVWAHLTVAVERNADGRPAFFISAIEDVTERKRAEQALNESERRLRTLTEALPQLVWTADQDGKVDYVNKRWAAFTGYSGDIPEHPGSFTLIHPDDLANVKHIWARAVAAGSAHETELRLKNRDGQYRWFLARALPLRNENGKVERWFGTCTDIHDLKVAQETLVRSEKLATVGRMAMTIAHEINNPLAAVMNILFLARGGQLPDSVRQQLDMADGELIRIAHITRQALGFYRESATAKPTSLNMLMESVIELLKSKIKAKHVVLSKEWHADVQITAVAGELRQVFSNLLSNSIDAVGDNGRVRLRIRDCKAGAESERTVRITVADNGKGIAVSALPRIFEPFFTTKDAVGTGLGLWVSKQIVEKHNGAIRVRSRSQGPTTGTVISVRLPVHTATEQVATSGHAVANLGSNEFATQAADPQRF